MRAVPLHRAARGRRDRGRGRGEQRSRGGVQCHHGRAVGPREAQVRRRTYEVHQTRWPMTPKVNVAPVCPVVDTHGGSHVTNSPDGSAGCGEACPSSRRGRSARAMCVTNLASSSISADASQPEPDSAGTVWLCRPGQANDPGTASLTTTVISSGGSRHIVHYKSAADPPIDCFYLYPNVSAQDSPK